MSSLAETYPDGALVDDPAPSTDAPAAPPPLTIIEHRSDWSVVDLGELWRFRELILILIWRDIKVRYKQTVLGAAWAVLQPLATMVVFTMFLGKVVDLPDASYPYSLYVYAGLLPWTFFSAAVANAGQSVVGNQNLVTKVYFPRIIIPMGSVGAALVDLAIAFAMLVVLMIYHGIEPGPGLLLLPLITLILILAALGVGAFLSALTVAYRDFRHAVPFLVQFWMFATPIIYMGSASLGPQWRAFLPLNPAYGLIGAFRQSALGGPIDWGALAVSSAMSAILVVLGALYFRRVERGFADII